MVSYEKHCAEPWLSHIASGKKVTEGRVKKGIFAGLVPGDTVTWFDGDLRVPTEVVAVAEYRSFPDYLDCEGVHAVLPDPSVASRADGLRVYRQFFSEEDEAKYGVVAIKVKLL